MTYSIKNIIKVILFALLIIPILFGVYTDYLYVRSFNLAVFLILIFGSLFLYILGGMIVKIGFNEVSLLKMEKHEVIRALREKKIISLITFFPITILTEELIFRYYLIGFLLLQIQLGEIVSIFISSGVFSLYHLHVWFTFKNPRILIGYLAYSFLLGLLTAYLLLTLGLIFCFILHFSLVFLIYIRIHTIIIKKKR